jgi:hypothetical protein
MASAFSQVWSAVWANPTALSALAASLSALVALLAGGVIAPFVSFAIAKRQIRASVVSTNRQAWINALRDDLAEMLELAFAHFYLREGTLSGEEGLRYNYEQRTRLRLLENRIRLRLNPNETPNQELLSFLRQVRRLSVARDPAAESDFEQAMERAIVKAQEILRAEWRRVKTGR